MKKKRVVLIFLFFIVQFMLIACNKVYYSTITFITNGGEPIADLTGKVGSELVLPSPKYENYLFEGWYKDNSFSEKFIDEKFPEKNTTIYAKWNIKKYEILIHENNGNQVKTAFVLENDFINLNTPILEGFKFDSWYYDKALTKKFDPKDIFKETKFDLYAKYNCVDSRYAFVSPTGLANGFGTQLSPLSLKEALIQNKKIYLLPGVYEMNEQILLGNDSVLIGIEDVILDFNNESEGINVYGESNKIINISVTKALEYGFSIRGSNNLLLRSKAFENRGNGFYIGADRGFKEASNNTISACEAYENFDSSRYEKYSNGIYVDSSVGNNNQIDGTMAYKNGNNGIVISNNDNNEIPGITIVTNSIVYGNGNSNYSDKSFEYGNGFYLGENERYLYSKIENSIAFDNFNCGIYSNSNGGITITKSTFYENGKQNIFMNNSIQNRIIDTLSFKDIRQYNDVFSGYIENSIIINNNTLAKYNNFSKKIDSLGVVISNFTSDNFKTKKLSTEIIDDKLETNNFLTNDLLIGANINKNSVSRQDFIPEENIIYSLTLDHLTPNFYLPKNIKGQEISYAGEVIINLTANEEKIFGNYFVKINEKVLKSDIEISVNNVKKALKYEKLLKNYDPQILDFTSFVDVIVGANYIEEDIKIIDKSTGEIIPNTAYILSKETYFIDLVGDNRDLVSTVDTTKVGAYEINYTIVFDQDLTIRLTKIINIISELTEASPANELVVYPDGILRGDVINAVGDIYAIEVKKGSKSPTINDVISGGNYSGVEVIKHISGKISKSTIELSGFVYNQGNEVYVVFKNGVSAGDPHKVEMLDKTIVKNSYDFINALAQNKKYIVLNNDIDLSGSNFTIDKYSGIIDGNNFSIKNYKYKYNEKVDHVGMISQLSNSKISNLTFTGCTISSNANFTGLLAGYAYNVELDNVKINKTSVDGEMYSGGIFGKTSGKISLNRVEFSNQEKNTISSKNIAGGIIGIANNDWISIKNTLVKTDILADKFVGGIIGEIDFATLNNASNFESIYVLGKLKSKQASGVFGRTKVLLSTPQINVKNILIDTTFEALKSYSFYNGFNAGFSEIFGEKIVFIEKEIFVNNAVETVKKEDFSKEKFSQMFDFDNVWQIDENLKELFLR